LTGKQTENHEAAVFFNVMKTEESLRSGLARLLKDFGLSPPQYNVLRILRGARPEGLRCQEISARMMTRVPDITRLLDRLVQAQLVTRKPSHQDRRVVVTRLRKKGLRLLSRLDGPIADLHRRQTAGLSRRQMQQLSRLLVKMQQESS
jgi:DNA-binding MarR family transcriptional regulator